MWASSSTSIHVENQILPLEVLGKINHGFHLPYGHRYRLHTHESLIGSEYGEFDQKSYELQNLKQKLNNNGTLIEAWRLGEMISTSSWVVW